MKRRGFVIGIGTGVAGALTWRFLGPPRTGQRQLRPPGALPEPAFGRTCVRCGICAAVCPRQCIELSDLIADPEQVGLPQIDARRRACDLCMLCTEVCPTQALRPIAKDPDTVLAEVSMGLAVVDEGLCISFLGRLCGPLPRCLSVPRQSHQARTVGETDRHRRHLRGLRFVRGALPAVAHGDPCRPEPTPGTRG